MRFFEFKAPIAGNNIDKEITSEVETLSDIVDQSPELEPKINKELQKLVDLAKSSTSQTPEIEDPKEPSETEDINFSENNAAPTLASLEKQLMEMLPNVDAAIKKQIKAKLKNIVQVAKQEAFSDLDNRMTVLMSNLKQVPQVFSKLISDELTGMLVKNEIDESTVFNFLEKCASPERIIDMPSIVSKSSTAMSPFTIPEEYQSIVKRLATLKPQGSNAAAGKGELVLTLIGKDTIKPPVGDIVVGSKKIEVKASDISGSGVTDFALASKKQNVQAARTVFVNAVNSVFKKPIYLDAEAKISKNGITGISSINRTHLKNLQPIFQKMGASLVKSTFQKMFEIVGLPKEDITEVLAAFNNDGTVDMESYSKALVKSSFRQYQKNNKHDGLLTINVKNLTYTYTENSEDFSELKNIQVERLFDFRPNPSVFTSFKQLS